MTAKVLINANAVVNIIFLSNIAFLIVLLCPSPSESGFFDGGFLLGWQCWDNIKFVSELERPNEGRKICLDKKKLHVKSKRSEIYAGWFSDDKGKYEYAIKKYKNAELAYTNSVEIFSRIKKIPNEAERRLLINAVEWGHIEGNNEEAVIVMELVGQDLDSFLGRSGPADFSDDKRIRPLIRLLAQPLDVFHREVGVHLDVKPGNFLFAKDKTGVFLKLNDFDGSHAFPANIPLPSEDERANAGVTFKRSLLNHTADYSSPDLYRANRDGSTVLTTKADIWSLGMSIYDVLLYRLDNKQYESVRKFMVELFQNGRLNNPDNHGKDLKWLLFNLDSFKVLFRIKTEFPDTFQLLNNLLNPDPAARMSARGVVNYAKGRCRPNVLAQVRGNVVIFDTAIADSLLNIQLSSGSTDLNTMLEKLKKLLEKSISKSKHEQQEAELANNNNKNNDDDRLPKLLPECQTN